MRETEVEAYKRRFLADFERGRPALTAIGDEVRQGIIMTLIESGGQGGLRVGEIKQRTSVSRSAVSHHLKVLMEAGIINVRREGTKNYYFLDPQSSSLKHLAKFWEQVEPMMALCERLRDERMSGNEHL